MPDICANAVRKIVPKNFTQSPNLVTLDVMMMEEERGVGRRLFAGTSFGLKRPHSNLPKVTTNFIRGSIDVRMNDLLFYLFGISCFVYFELAKASLFGQIKINQTKNIIILFGGDVVV